MKMNRAPLLTVLILSGLLPAIPAWSQAESAEKEEIVMVGKDVLLKADETSRKIIVVSGSVTIQGTVRQDVVVVSGSATVEGKIRGNLTVVAGDATLGPEAEVKRNVVVVGGRLNTQPTSKIGRKQMVYSTELPGFRRFWDWVAKGLLWARPLPPQFLWVWILAGVVLLGYLLLAMLFPRPVQACVDTLGKRPFGSFFFGLLVFLLFAPLVTLLSISVIGIVIVPFVGCALVAAFLFGKVAVYRYTGQQIGLHLGQATLQQPLLALVLGAVLFCLLYTIPVVGLLVWGVILPLGVGAAVLAFFRSFRTESAGTTPPVAVAGEPAGPGIGLSAVPPVLLARVGFWRRFFATLLDFVLLSSMLRVFRHHAQIFLILWLVYHVAFWAWKGTTIGGIVLGIKIVRTDSHPMDFAVALVRALSSIFSAMALFLGFFWAGWSREKQSWHDKIAGTAVVRPPKGASLL